MSRFFSFLCLHLRAVIVSGYSLIAHNDCAKLIDSFNWFFFHFEGLHLIKRTAKTQIDGENVKRRWKCKKIAKKHKKPSINYKRCAKWDLNESYRWWNLTRNELQRLINWSVSILHVYFGSSFWNHQTY